jgi:rhodanese-related sulfurtransferase
VRASGGAEALSRKRVFRKFEEVQRVTREPVTIEDVSPREAWDRLRGDGAAVLVDVRSRAEWALVGLPDLAEIGKQVVRLEWQTYPDGWVDPGFADRLAIELEGSGATKETAVYFLCRSGVRSRSAARAMAEKGFARCFNVADGFEGPLDANRQRGRLAGWKAAGLPWVQG